MHTVVVCFPRQQMPLVEQYMSNREITVYDEATTLEKAEEKLKEVEEDGQCILYLFDFINEAGFFDIYQRYEQKVKYLQVVTTKAKIAQTYSDITDAIYFVKPMMDLVSLFWDSEIFKLDNALKASSANLDLISLEPLNTVGVDVQSLDLSMKTSKYKGTDILNLSITGKIKGRSIAKRNFPIQDTIKRSFYKQIGELDEMSATIEDIQKDIQEESEEENQYYEGNVGKANIYTRLQQLVKHLDEAYPKSINQYLVKELMISQKQADQLIKLREINEITTITGELEYCLKEEWINEDQYIEAMREYYRVECLSRMEVESREVLFTGVTLDFCLQNYCFPTNSFDKDSVTIVIDFANVAARDQVALTFNNYRFIYARNKDIFDRLNAIKKAREAAYE